MKGLRRLTPPERLLYWIRERWNVKLLRHHGQPPPWTTDLILQHYKWCNVRRDDDKVSRWLINNWYRPHPDHPNAVVACVLARQVNLIPSLAAVGFPLTWRPSLVQEILEARMARGEPTYGRAYVVTGNLLTQKRPRQSKPFQTAFVVCDAVWKVPPKVDVSSLQRTWEGLLGYPGQSNFIAGQVVADLKHALAGSWEDGDHWAPAGPGSSRALCRLLGQEVRKDLTQQEFLGPFRAWLEWYRSRRCVPALSAMDFQNCLCEWDKYERLLSGESKYFHLYHGGA